MERSDFKSFFFALWGHYPRAWQERLLDSLLAHGQWPSSISAPTGSGKSAVIDVHIFANALAATGAGCRVPRRMAICVNRRAMVDQHEVRARQIAEALTGATSGILEEVREALASLITRADTEITNEPLAVLSLRGGITVNRDWIHDPSVCSVIAVTPEMWGSRALFSGYGSSSGARPREAGLLVIDTVLVLDEAHLNRQLTVLAQDLEKLNQPVADALGVPSFQFCATTATPVSEGGEQVGVEAHDFLEDHQLERALTRPKPVTYHEAKKQSSNKASDAYIRELAECAEKLRAEQVQASEACNTTGVIVNRVDTATRVAAYLRSRHGEDAVVCWVGRMRPMDLARLRKERPGILEPRGDDTVSFLVATQTVEVGVDLDLGGLVTELASGSALAQRAGRINRRGLRSFSPIWVVGPTREDIAAYAPYDESELLAAYDWVTTLAETDAGLSPWAVSAPELLPPRARTERASFTALVEAEARYLSETSRPPFQEPDLSFWLRDSLEPETELVSIVMRTDLFTDDSLATGLLSATPPVKDEMFPVRIREAKNIVEHVLDESVYHRAFIWTDDCATQLTMSSEIQPGSVVIIDVRRQTVAGVLTDEGPFDSSRPLCLWEPVQGGLSGEPPYLLQRHDPDDGVSGTHRMSLSVARLIDALSEVDQTNKTPEEAAQEFRELVFEATGQGLDVTLGLRDQDGQLLWAILSEPKNVADDPELRQAWSPSGKKVSLDAHSQAVAHRAQTIGHRLGIHERWVEALRQGALAHDLGKTDKRFQQFTLNNADPDVLLAKSGRATSQQVRRRLAQSPLPRGWRHEQLSATIVMADANDSAGETGLDADVIARLAGTSHGHGRPFFPHSAEHLLPAQGTQPELYSVAVRRTAHDLFDSGAGWQDILATSERKLGLWGIAFLEAVLRSADCMASKEGS